MSGGKSLQEDATMHSAEGNGYGPDADVDYKYWAFISYSHQDEIWAAWLHRSLETFRLPKGVAGMDFHGETVPKHLRPVFRDRDELPGASDLGGKLRSYLRKSRTLIVVCSEKSSKSKWVNEEVRYFKSLGRAENVLCLVVSGDVEGGVCFPEAVLKRIDAEGNFVGDEGDPLAADVRPGKDGKEDALLKLIAGILDIGFDRLKQREARRKKLRLIQWSAGVVGSMVALVLGYLLLADIGVGVPGRDGIQLALDRSGWSVARAPQSDAEVMKGAEDLRNRLEKAMDRALEEDGWLSQTLRTGDVLPQDAFSHSQAMVALCRAPSPDGWDRAKLYQAIRRPFVAAEGKTQSNFDEIYIDLKPERRIFDSCGAFWMVTLHSDALGKEGLVPFAQRKSVEADLAKVQQVLERYRGADGGWTMFPNPGPGCPTNAYSTTLALQSLLACKRAGQPWLGSVEKRDELLVSAAKWLQGRFNEAGGGWQGTGENAYEIFDGLTLQAFSALLAAREEAGIEVPAPILTALERQIIGCVERSQDYPVASGEFEAEFEWLEGRTVQRKEAYRFLWYPWALEAIDRWLDHAAVHPQPSETVFRVKRARSHLVLEVGPKLVDTIEEDWLFIAAETLYGLSSVPVK